MSFVLLSLCFVVDPIKIGLFTKYDAGLAGVMAARYFGGEGDAARFMREEAAARRALAMASLAIATAAEDCPIEYRDESSFMAFACRPAEVRQILRRERIVVIIVYVTKNFRTGTKSGNPKFRIQRIIITFAS